MSYKRLPIIVFYYDIDAIIELLKERFNFFEDGKEIAIF